MEYIKTLLSFCCALLLCGAMLHALDASPLHKHDNLERRNTDIDCTTPLGKDLYGLGVRLGIYFQWFSGWLSNNFVVDEVAGGLDANSIFMFALVIAIVHTTSTDELTQIDAIIMLLLCAGTFWSVLSIWGYRTCIYRKEGLDGIRHFGRFGTHLRLILGAAVSWYCVWFWTSGVTGLPHGLAPFGVEPPPSCEKVVVFTVPIDGPVRYFALAIGIVALTYNVLLTAAAPIAVVTRIRKMIMFLRSGSYASSTRLRFATGANPKQLHRMSCVFGTLNIIWIIFAILFVELSLSANRIYGVLGGSESYDNGSILQPGQLLPMLIGAFSFVRILFITFELWRSPRGDISPSLGRSKSNRAAKSRRDSTRFFNMLKIFSVANEMVEEHQALNPESTPEEAEPDPLEELQGRLSVFQRIMITWLPWLSLLYFWPWSKQADSARHQNPERDDAEMVSMNVGYQGVSRPPYDDGQPRQPRSTV